jgi:hypothetical protein
VGTEVAALPSLSDKQEKVQSIREQLQALPVASGKASVTSAASKAQDLDVVALTEDVDLVFEAAMNLPDFTSILADLQAMQQPVDEVRGSGLHLPLPLLMHLPPSTLTVFYRIYCVQVLSYVADLHDLDQIAQGMTSFFTIHLSGFLDRLSVRDPPPSLSRDRMSQCAHVFCFYLLCCSRIACSKRWRTVEL